MEGKTVAESQVVMSQIMTPLDVNNIGNVHGGVIMKLVDTAAGIAAIRHSRSISITASIDRLSFLHPVHVGELVTLKASVNMVGNTSMETGVRVEAEGPITGKVRHVASAYLTFVAVDKQNKPKPVPPLILSTEREQQRNREAVARREIRLRELHPE
jgi:uncharacterized protein (TIGR00369 family)